MEEANTRQLVSRARKRIADGRRTPRPVPAEQRRLLEAFIAAAQKGDMAALEGLFAEDVVSCSNGGGIVRTARVSRWFNDSPRLSHLDVMPGPHQCTPTSLSNAGARERRTRSLRRRSDRRRGDMKELEYG